MSSIANTILALRRDERILLKLPKYISLLVIVFGLGWLCLLPLNEYSRRTYVSENGVFSIILQIYQIYLHTHTDWTTALLPGQVHTYFANSEHNIFRAYRHEVASYEHITSSERTAAIKDIFNTAGLKTATQSYNYTNPTTNEVLKSGENVYAILQGPRADATEAMVLIASWKNMDDKINYSGVALVLTLARYFNRWSLWSKDILFLITEDSTAGSQAWVDAYHDAHDHSQVQSLSLKSGALQGAVALDYPAGPWGHRFEKLHIVYDGINGALPNLDLFNTAVSIASGQMGISCTLQRMFKHTDSYKDRLLTMTRGMLSQGLGHATGPHSAFIPYHIDAITMQTVGDGWHDEMSLGRSVEGLFRSLNNLLEHLHQSFFFYLLMEGHRFVSIGTYLPSAMLVAGGFTVMSVGFWVLSGRVDEDEKKKKKRVPMSTRPKGEKSLSEEQEMTAIKSGEFVSLIPTVDLKTSERHLFLPLTILTGIHFLGLVPLYTFTHLPIPLLAPLFNIFTISILPLPYILAYCLPKALGRKPTKQEMTLTQCFALMLLGLSLSALATLNFSLSLIIGVLLSPISFIRPVSPSSPLKLATNILQVAVMTALSPPVVIGVAVKVAGIEGVGLAEVLEMAMSGWWIHGIWTGIVVWLVWWPGWVAGSFVVGCGLFAS
jgi:glycosylphosphatidylinositol transamidase